MLELRHLRKEFDDHTIPLKDVNAVINDGDIIAVIGPSGTGKSTLLRCINMLEEPTSGEILLDGKVINDGKCDLNEVRKKMGMVFQSFNLFGHLTVIENIMNPQITLLGRSRQEAYDNAMDLLYKVGLDGKALSYPDELSGGQQQRIAIARTLAMDPEVILFDEPTSALDPSMIGEVQSVISLVAKNRKCTIMIVTHEMDFAKKISSRVFFMDEGGIYEEGSPKQIFEHPRKEKTKRFIQRLSSLNYHIDSTEFDFQIIYDELQEYAEKHLIENERTSKLQLALEEIIANNIFLDTEYPDILVKIDYAEKKDILSMQIKYCSEHFDPNTCENALFMEILAEPTTVIKDEQLTDPEDQYTSRLSMSLKWPEEEED